MYSFSQKKLLAATCSLLAAILSIVPVASSELRGVDVENAAVTHPFLAKPLTGSTGNYDTSFFGQLPTELLDQIVSNCDLITSGALVSTHRKLIYAVKEQKYFQVSGMKELKHYAALMKWFPDMQNLPVYVSYPCVPVLEAFPLLQGAPYLYFSCTKNFSDGTLGRLPDVRQIVLNKPTQITDRCLDRLHKDTKITVLFTGDKRDRLTPKKFEDRQIPKETLKFDLVMAEKFDKIATAEEKAIKKRRREELAAERIAREAEETARKARWVAREEKAVVLAERALAQAAALVAARPTVGARALARLAAEAATRVAAPGPRIDAWIAAQRAADAVAQFARDRAEADEIKKVKADVARAEEVVTTAINEAYEVSMSAYKAAQAAAAHAGDKRKDRGDSEGEPKAKRPRGTTRN